MQRSMSGGSLNDREGSHKGPTIPIPTGAMMSDLVAHDPQIALSEKGLVRPSALSFGGRAIRAHRVR